MADKRQHDEETNGIIWQGATQTQLLRMFKVDQPRVKSAISKVKPCGYRGALPIYNIAEIAPYIVRPHVTPEAMEEYLKDSDHRALPPSLRKEFWIGMRQRQEYQLKAGELWPTTKVVENVGKLFKLVNMSARLMVDAVEHQVELSDRQRQIIKDETSAMLKDLRRTVTETFSKPEGVDVPIHSAEELIAQTEDDDEF